MGLYTQPEKDIARRELISHAILSLTDNRFDSVIVTKDGFKAMYENFYNLLNIHLEKNGYAPIDAKEISKVEEEWYRFYESKNEKRNPGDLKVLYLTGPEPLNDLNVFLENGISPYNIVGVESDKGCFSSAIESLEKAGITIKIYKGSLQEYFKLFDEVFDIVYFDGCTPIVSKSYNPLIVLRELFINRRLSHLSALITNFAEPQDNFEDWSKLLACWFAPHYQECPVSTHESRFSDVEERCIDIPGYSDFIKDRITEYYSEFIIRFICTFAAEMIPFWKTISLRTLQSKYFWDDAKLNELLVEIRDEKIQAKTIEELLRNTPQHILAPGSYPLLSWAYYTANALDNDHPIVLFLKERFDGKSLYDAVYILSLLKNFEEARSGFKTFTRDVCSKQLREVLDELDFFDRNWHLAVDIPMKNLIVELVIGSFSYPYICNASKLKSLKYKAKETWMYSDVFIFDQCRYLYDFVPPVDLMRTFFDNPRRQIIARCCIDAIKRKHFRINSNLFKWGFFEGAYEKRFPTADLNLRENINDRGK